jgi:apolipoprotein N-acyltransferase
MDPQQALDTAKALGFTLPSPGYIFGAILFGLIGLVAFRAGRKQQRPRAVWIGVALMLYPYLISQTWAIYAVGVALCAGLWVERRF